jgi:hypothetical protein
VALVVSFKLPPRQFKDDNLADLLLAIALGSFLVAMAWLFWRSI